MQFGENIGQHACEQIDNRQQVSEGGHFMELLVSQIIIQAELWTVHFDTACHFARVKSCHFTRLVCHYTRGFVSVILSRFFVRMNMFLCFYRAISNNRKF